MREVDVQREITRSIGAIIGPPSRLTAKSAVVLSVLLTLTARMLRLTLRKANDPDTARVMKAGFEAIGPEQIRHFRRGEPVSDPSIPEDTDPQVTALLGPVFLELFTQQPYKKPSHLILGALASLCGQFAALRNETVNSLSPLLEKRWKEVRQDQVEAFQEFAARTRSN